MVPHVLVGDWYPKVILYMYINKHRYIHVYIINMKLGLAKHNNGILYLFYTFTYKHISVKNNS